MKENQKTPEWTAKETLDTARYVIGDIIKGQVPRMGNPPPPPPPQPATPPKKD